MQSNEIRKKFIEFFEKRGHKVVPSASLVPENDPSVLYNTAGMQPLVPYLLGQPHPAGKRIVNIQKCVRTGDLEDVGDNRHLSFFEMMGNWSLGDYFKEDAIKWSYEFLTSKEEGLGLDLNRLYFTCFAGDENAPRDDESAQIWQSLGVKKEQLFFLGAEDNWWSPGDNGPCGPDTEMFYDVTGEFSSSVISEDEFLQAVKAEKLVEIWNNVFMEYEKKDGKVVGKLAMKNVDTGAGLERMSAVMQGKSTSYDTDLFAEIFAKINEFSNSENAEKNETDKKNVISEKNGDDENNEKTTKAKRIVADHIRTAVFIIADGVLPANTDRGYVLRRLLRRAVRFSDILKIPHNSLSLIAKEVIKKFAELYPNLSEDQEKILTEIDKEENRFRETLERGLKAFEKGEDPFVLFTSYGFPIELTEELAKENGQEIDRAKFDGQMKEHQDKSRAGAEQKFKGGLANTNEATIKLHTAHHLLLSALQNVLGKSVKQRGSNITDERLRIDFTFERKMTDEEKQKVEDLVNEAIKNDYKVERREMSLEDASKIGAEMEFGAKYGETVSVYFIEDQNGNAISKEFCGGPHVERTGILGKFKIQKEEASSQGIRRIKAVLL